MQIGELAKLSGLGVETVRFYERQGLLKAKRSPAGYRHFGEDAPVRLRFVVKAKTLGFTLDEIRDLLGLRLDPGATKQDVRERTRAKLKEIEEKAAQLAAMKRALEGLLDCCHGKGKASACPILDSLEA